jgi:predicted lysophospholipase L1 biosynthesis ABC-type transport system permease subunit
LVKAGLRIMIKSWRLAWRAQRRFWVFIAVYFVLIGMVTYLVRAFLQAGDAVSLLWAILGGLLVATLYGFLLTTFRKTEIATLKCIGWSNSNLRVLIIGEILLISCLAFLIFVEVGIHIAGLAFYLTGQSTGALFIVPGYIQSIFTARDILPWTFVLVVAAQLPGVLIANYRILAVKPMEALRMP